MENEIKDVLKSVGDSIESKTIKVEIDIPVRGKMHAILQKWKLKPAKRTLEIKPITLGNLTRISTLLLNIDVKALSASNLLEDNYGLMKEHCYTLSRIVAIAATNTKEEPGQKLIGFIQYAFTAEELMKVLSVVIQQMNITSFMSCILSVKGMNILQQRSPEAPGGTIALGESLEPL